LPADRRLRDIARRIGFSEASPLGNLQKELPLVDGKW